jgi:hypothetical protein
VSHDGYVDKNKKQKQKHNKTANYEPETNKPKINSSLSGLFVCNHIVFSHVVAMTNYLLPSPPVQNASLMGRIPRPPMYYKKKKKKPTTPKVLQKNIQIKENKNEEQKDNTI